MHLSDLQSKMVVSTKGKHLGVIIDAEINNTGQIVNFVIMNKKLRKIFLKEPMTVIFVI